MKKKQLTLVVQVKVKKDMLRDYLRFRRALKQITRLYDPGNGTTYDMIATAMLGVAKRALWKGEKR